MNANDGNNSDGEGEYFNPEEEIKDTNCVAKVYS